MPSRRFEQIVEHGRSQQLDRLSGRAPLLIRMTQDVLSEIPSPQSLPAEDNEDINLQRPDGSFTFLLGYSALGGGDTV